MITPAPLIKPPPNEPIRHRYLADRILLLLLYSASDASIGLERLAPDAGGGVLLRMGPLSRALRLNSSKLYDQLLFLQHTGYLEYVDYKFKWNHVLVKPTKPQVSWPA